ncbi:MAG TPA: DUF3237 domain-containing protein [Kofleriaceae bacterium]|jgi:hypothetical protein
MPDHDRSDTAIEAHHLADMTLVTSATLVLDGAPSGTRVVVEFAEVEWSGDRIVAHRKGASAADWLAIGPDGTGMLDIRLLLETRDGALVYVHGLGRNHAREFTAGAPNYFSLVFETGDARYAWLNRMCAIAKGRLQPDGKTIQFAVYELR